MTSSERWELGLFLALLVVACLCLTAILNLNGVPRLFALRTAETGVKSDNVEGMIEAPAAAVAPTLDIAPQPETAPTLPGGGVVGRALPLSADRAAVTPAKPVAPKAKLAAKPAAPEVKVYNGKKYKYVKTLKLRVTAYAPDPRCTWPYPGTTTASGLSVKTNGGRLVASDPGVIPMHSLVVVPGYAGGVAVPVLDTGGAIKGRRLDVLLPTFEKAKDWGSKQLDVKVYVRVDD
jgi:3D (Asp-Asp-Asp) domain-containing protein